MVAESFDPFEIEIAIVVKINFSPLNITGSMLGVDPSIQQIMSPGTSNVQ